MNRDYDQEIFVSFDVETDGPIPGPHSMLSLGAAAFKLPNETPLATFSVNLSTLSNAGMDEQTLAFWKRYPKEYAMNRENQVHPATAMSQFADWLRPFGRNIVATAYPLGFDWTFVHWYFIQFLHRNPFGRTGLDLKTMAWTMMGGDFHSITKRRFPKEWFSADQHRHVAVEDAIEQGVMFVRMWKEMKKNAVV